jgi:hypothetical protein
MGRSHLSTDLTTGIVTKVAFTPEEEGIRDAEEAVAAVTAQRQEAATTERTAATIDLRDQAAAMTTALDAIIARNGVFTLAQAGQALDALAKGQKRLLRLLKAQVG